jgi:general secretion pathway protein D
VVVTKKSSCCRNVATVECRIGKRVAATVRKGAASSPRQAGLRVAVFNIMPATRVALLLVAALAAGPATARAAGSPAARPAVEKRDARHEAAPGADDDRPTNACRKLPAGKRIVRLNLKPDTSVTDLVGWISAITCTPFIVPSTLGAESKKVTIVSPTLITREEAYRLFLGALDSVGLTVYPTGKFQRVIEAPKAKTSPIPFCVVGDDATDCTP